MRNSIFILSLFILFSCGSKQSFNNPVVYHNYIVKNLDSLHLSWDQSTNFNLSKEENLKWNDTLTTTLKKINTNLSNLTDFMGDSTYKLTTLKFIQHLTYCSSTIIPLYIEELYKDTGEIQQNIINQYHRELIIKKDSFYNQLIEAQNEFAKKNSFVIPK